MSLPPNALRSKPRKTQVSNYLFLSNDFAVHKNGASCREQREGNIVLTHVPYPRALRWRKGRRNVPCIHRTASSRCSAPSSRDSAAASRSFPETRPLAVGVLRASPAIAICCSRRTSRMVVPGVVVLLEGRCWGIGSRRRGVRGGRRVREAWWRSERKMMGRREVVLVVVGVMLLGLIGGGRLQSDRVLAFRPKQQSLVPHFAARGVTTACTSTWPFIRAINLRGALKGRPDPGQPKVGSVERQKPQSPRNWTECAHVVSQPCCEPRASRRPNSARLRIIPELKNPTGGSVGNVFEVSLTPARAELQNIHMWSVHNDGWLEILETPGLALLAYT